MHLVRVVRDRDAKRAACGGELFGRVRTRAVVPGAKEIDVSWVQDDDRRASLTGRGTYRYQLPSRIDPEILATHRAAAMLRMLGVHFVSRHLRDERGAEGRDAVLALKQGLTNKPSSVEAKEWTLRRHLVPALGDLRLDQVTYAVIEDLKIEMAKKPARNKSEATVPPTLSAKSINNCLTILRRMLVIARKRGLIEAVPEVDWLKVPPQEFDFLDFEEAKRLLGKVDEEWHTMVLVALRSGMRMGELIALRWQDVDLVAGKITVRQCATRTSDPRSRVTP